MSRASYVVRWQRSKKKVVCAPYAAFVHGLMPRLSRTYYLDCAVPAATAVADDAHQVARGLVEAVLLGVFWPLTWGYIVIVAPLISCFCVIDICEVRESCLKHGQRC